ncbi:MAG TPA: DUF58 domain-containing protein [Phycisphaerales bacterium]|nr:DUF58 domain-containing protein [Phycisphaerales bacterium]
MLIRPERNVPRSIEELLGPGLARRIDRLDLISRKVFAGKLPGERRSKRRGESVEFDDYRDYTPGDDLRRLDWNVFARFDRFFIKLFRAEEDLGLHILVDCSASMLAGGGDEPSKLVFAHRLAMALAYVGLVNQNRVSLGTFGHAGADPLRRLAPVRGRRQTARVAGFLLESVAQAEAQPTGSGADSGGRGPFERAMRAFGLSRAGSGVVVVITDALVAEGLEAGLNYLVGGGGVDATLVQTLAPSEIAPERAAQAGLVGDLRLTDAETGRGVEVTMSAPVIKRYKQRLDRHIERVQRACLARDVGHLLVPSDADVADLMLGQLRRRGILG